MKQRRQALGAAPRQQASEAIVRSLLASASYRNASVMAAYLAFSTEVQLGGLIEHAWQAGKQVFVPRVLAGAGSGMCFTRLDPTTTMVRNRFGISEPANGQNDLKRIDDLDLVLVPLLAFDARGNRLGMGAGFYDRYFARLRRVSRERRPVFCGVAYDCQRVLQLPAEDWDVPLDCVATEAGISWFNETERTE